MDLVLGKDIYLVNYYGFVSQLKCTFTDYVRDRLQHVGQNAIGIMFGGCLVILPAGVAVKNLGYLRPVGIPRRAPLVTGKGTHVYDQRKDLHFSTKGLCYVWCRVRLWQYHIKTDAAVFDNATNTAGASSERH